MLGLAWTGKLAVAKSCARAVKSNPACSFRDHVCKLQSLGFSNRSHWSRSHSNHLDMVCRQAAGDPRLLNPSQQVDCSPNAPRNAAGEPLVPTGTPWRPALLLMAVASGLLSSADKILQIQPAARSAQQQQAMAMLRGQRIPPVPYLVSQMVQPHKVSCPPCPWDLVCGWPRGP